MLSDCELEVLQSGSEHAGSMAAGCDEREGSVLFAGRLLCARFACGLVGENVAYRGIGR